MRSKEEKTSKLYFMNTEETDQKWVEMTEEVYEAYIEDDYELYDTLYCGCCACCGCMCEEWYDYDPDDFEDD